METKYNNSLLVKSVLDIYNNVMSKENTLNLKPRYQRNSIWDFNDKTSFIDSLHKNIVPTNIILHKNKDGTFECIDGKQRITSIIEFKQNMFPLLIYNGDDEKHVYFDNIPNNASEYVAKKKHKNIKYRLFTQEEKNNFNSINIPVVTYNELCYSDRVDIFSRIQNGKKLTLGENMAACLSADNICDEFNKYCKQFEHYFKGIGKINTNRFDHKCIISHIYYMIEHDQFGGKNKVVAGLRRIRENNLKTFIKRMDQIDAILKICFSDNIMKNIKLFGIDIMIDLLYAVIMFVHKNIGNDFSNMKTDIVTTILQLQKKYYKTKTKKPQVSELYREFVDTYNNLNKSNDTDDTDSYQSD